MKYAIGQKVRIKDNNKIGVIATYKHFPWGTFYMVTVEGYEMPFMCGVNNLEEIKGE